MNSRTLSEIIPLSNLVFVIAESGSGKSTFVKSLVSHLHTDISLHIQTREPSDFADLAHVVHFLKLDFTVDEHSFSTIPRKSLVILDDFSFQPKDKVNAKNRFLTIVNYYLRHHDITLLLVIHNMYNNNLFTDILLAPHIFLSYSNLGYYIIRKLQERLGGKEVLSFYQEPLKQNFNFCYINTNKNYIINKIDCLFYGKPVIMFSNKEKFIIHKSDESCQTSPSHGEENLTDSTHNAVIEFIKKTYPKQKYLTLVFEIMNNHNLIDASLFFIAFPNLHVADVCAFFNNRFDKNIDSRYIKFCKFLRQKKIRFPKNNNNMSVKNSKTYLVQCLSKDSVFHCNLEHEFRDIACRKSDICLSYEDNAITGEAFGSFDLHFNATSYLDVVVLRNIAPASTNPFTEISRQIATKLNLGNVSRPFSSVNIRPTGNEIQMRLTLLPYQILILPYHYLIHNMIKIKKGNAFEIITSPQLRQIITETNQGDLPILTTFSTNDPLLEQINEEVEDKSALYYLETYFRLFRCVGLKWTAAAIKEFEENPATPLIIYQTVMIIKFNDSDMDLFPRDATDPDSARKKERYLDFGIFTNAKGCVFQKIPVTASFENVHYNQFSQQYTKNSEYSNVLKTPILEAYNKSWIAKYFGYNAFVDPDTKTVSFQNSYRRGAAMDDSRYHVKVHLKSEKLKLYFASKPFWENVPDEPLLVDGLSEITNGMPTLGYPYTKSPYFTAPFFIIFKTNHAIDSNFLRYNEFLLPNSYSRVLCLLNYDDLVDKFVAVKKMDIVLPYHNALTLPSVLEFTIIDAEQNLVKFEDKSQLFISLTMS